MYCIPHIGYEYHTISWDGVYCIPKMGMLSVSREITPFWYEIHTFVLTVCHRRCYHPILNACHSLYSDRYISFELFARVEISICTEH